MSWKDVPLSQDRDTLAKQFRALRTVAISLEARLAHYEKQRAIEHVAQSQIEGERAANEILTARVEELEAAIDAILWYDHSDHDDDYIAAIEALRKARHS